MGFLELPPGYPFRHSFFERDLPESSLCSPRIVSQSNQSPAWKNGGKWGQEGSGVKASYLVFPPASAIIERSRALDLINMDISESARYINSFLSESGLWELSQAGSSGLQGYSSDQNSF